MNMSGSGNRAIPVLPAAGLIILMVVLGLAGMILSGRRMLRRQ